MQGDAGVTAWLGRLWLAGAVLLAIGVAMNVGGTLVAGPGLLALAVASGMTAARGRDATSGWLLLAWAVPVLPTVALVGTVAWWWWHDADLLAVFLLAYIGGAIVLALCVAFVVALAVETIRLRRRRRFVEPRPAWENGAPPPSYS
jgi:hypothetical protein